MLKTKWQQRKAQATFEEMVAVHARLGCVPQTLNSSYLVSVCVYQGMKSHGIFCGIISKKVQSEKMCRKPFICYKDTQY